jgi:choline-sulfatase
MRNVIVITSDELRADCPGFMSNPDCRTPALDRLAQHGVVFEQHFTVHGKCVPARIAMMTGRYPHTDGFRTIHQHLPADQPNLLALLRRQGYETAVFGHNHVWENLFAGEEKHKQRSDGAADYHSFVAPFHDLAFAAHAVPAANGPVACMIPGDGTLHSGRLEDSVQGFIDQNRARQAVKYLTQVRDRSRPFYLQVNMGSPHPAYRVEEPFFSMYDRAALRAWPHELPRNAPLPLRVMRAIRTGEDINERMLREVQAVYYGMVSRVDRDIGMVLDCLAHEGLLDTSIIVFTSDHGDFAGQYGLIEKWDTCMADCIMRTPLIIAAPELARGARVTAFSEHVDLPSTILDLLGLAPDWGVHGASLLPLLHGAPGKPAVFADGGHEQEMWRRFNFGAADEHAAQKKLNGKQRTYQTHPESMARTKMVRTKQHKLVVRLAGGNELYDLQRDPWELDNRWGDPALREVTLALQQMMIEWCLRTDTDRPHQALVGA